MVNIKHPWHGIEIGENAPNIINTIIEIPKDCRIKYELDKDSGLLKMDRVMYSAIHYPGDYGFIPQTLWEDNDPLDVLIFAREGAYPMCLAKVRVIGVLHMKDDGESDDKILAVHEGDPRFSEWKSPESIPPHYIKELRHFFETYKELQGKKVEVYNIHGPDVAYECIKKSQRLYKERFGNQSKTN